MNQMLKIQHPKSIDLILMKTLSLQRKNQKGQSTLGFPLTISWPTPRMRCPIPTDTKVTMIRRNKFRCQFWNLGPSQKRKHTFDESTFIFTTVFSYLYLWININKIRWKIEVKISKNYLIHLMIFWICFMAFFVLLRTTYGTTRMIQKLHLMD